MPVYENSCSAVGECPEAGNVFEWIARNFEAPDPPCSVCGRTTQRQVSRFGVVWTGPLTNKYLDRDVEGGHGDGAHWAYKNNTRSGKPEPVWIDSFDAQRRFCKEEGLGNPNDTGPARISADGKTLIPISHAEAKDLREANGRQLVAEQKDKASTASRVIG